jgi:ABC-2 type transport system permease protein
VGVLVTSSYSLQRTASVARKEFLHILRDPMTLFFTLFVPIVEMLMLGYAIDTNVRDVRTVVLDQADTEESRALIRRFTASGTFRVVRYVRTGQELNEEIVAGRARVGIWVPQHYSKRTTGNDTAEVLLLVDGSDSSVASSAVSTGQAIVMSESLGNTQLRVDYRPTVLFNPDTRSANFFIPGLMVVMCQMMAVMLSATTIVREKEKGTLEQLFMTPVRVGELLIGKLVPYLGLTAVEFCSIAFLMQTLFAVPIHGSFFTLAGLFLPFLLAMIGVGLWVSTKASTRDAAMQLSMGTVIPSIFLSGYVFPLDSMPPFFYYVAQAIPTTWMIDAARGVILRGAGWKELWLHAVVLWSMTVAMLLLSTLRFHKRLS